MRPGFSRFNARVAPLLRDLLSLPQAADGDGSNAPFKGAVSK